MPSVRASGLLASGAVVGASLAGLLALDDLRTSTTAYLLLFGAALTGYAGALLLLREGSASRRTALAIVASGALFRALLVPAAPSLSDDIYRYVWDGRVQAAGMNPYEHEPLSRHLRPLRDREVHPRVNHPDIRTIYPPVAQVLFLAARGPFDSVTGMKALLAALDVGTSLLLLRLLTRRGRPGWVVVHAWSPLCIVELAHSGHMDALPIFLLVLALERADAGRHAWAALALGAAAAAKLFALVALPFFARRWRGAWIVAPATIAAFYLPYAGAGARLFDGLATFAAHWSFNGSAFELLSAPLPHLGAQLVAGAFVAALALWLWKRPAPVETAVLALLAAVLVLSATVHPWYVTWLVPLAALRYSIPAIVWSGTAALAYTVFLRGAGEAWEPLPLARVAEYAIPFALLAIRSLTASRTAPYPERT